MGHDKPLAICDMEGESWFEIRDYDRFRPFFMSIVSDSDLWMFISANGGLSAGRRNAEYALFPYYTDDKITDMAEITGSKTIIRLKSEGQNHVWEPFSIRSEGLYQIRRNLYKNRYGNKILFEEVNTDLGLKFSYQWNSSSRFGFIKKSKLVNLTNLNRDISVLDGIQNVLPYGVESAIQATSSNLADAYKRTELVEDTGLAIFSLSAFIVDKAEPSEALKVNTAWSTGLNNPEYLVSSLQLDDFRKGKEIRQENDVKGEKGAYFVLSDLTLTNDSESSWLIAADVNQNHARVIELNEWIRSTRDPGRIVWDDIEKGSRQLLRLTAAADGIQHSSDRLKNARHYSNVLFNIMRGGIFDDQYRIDKEDYRSYLYHASRDVYKRQITFIEQLSNTFSYSNLCRSVSELDDPDLERLTVEYLPLKFSRRHGDPSRPWNRFSINLREEQDGSKILDYEGNWRDIFQNWEVLALSYPGFTLGMIYKFVNASTFEGYNPYRVTKGGFDWETIDPDDPWSYIGYWGDHQIIYLLKFLEYYDRLEPGRLQKLFAHESFVYAHIPYRIKSYEEIVRDPKDTIGFDSESDQKIRARMKEIGADGALLETAAGGIHHVNFLEKLLAAVLSKLSNFIPEAGIWMNTQRPEWNDANNALVGNGVSMVTLYYLRRFMVFFESLLASSDTGKVTVSSELLVFFTQTANVLGDHKDLLSGKINDIQRKNITDLLGRAGSDYRNTIYDAGFSGEKSVLDPEQLSDFIRNSIDWLEHSIEANRRDDHLYHSYNLMSLNGDGIEISRLSEMLEGQVAVLSSGFVDAAEAASLLDSLRNSALYREDQNSYILYPDKKLPGFMDKNTIPPERVSTSRLLQKLISVENYRIISRDIRGGYHFNGNFRNAGDLKKELLKLKSAGFDELVEQEQDLILAMFEEVFNHKAFTGRSGTFFAYEGLGSIYWHMVSKLHLAVQEVCLKANRDKNDSSLIQKLKAHYYEIGEGIGIHKSPEQYGAFPTDPYSHTPAHRGAQQPGMTGQVKEDILVRFGELGVMVKGARLEFHPGLLRRDEFLQDSASMTWVDVNGSEHETELTAGTLAYTYCQVPVHYRLSDSDSLVVEYRSGETKRFNELKADPETSRLVFGRTGDVVRCTVNLDQKRFSNLP